MTIPAPGLGSHGDATATEEFWRRRGLLAPHARAWVGGVCVEDPALPPWMPLAQRPEGWWRGVDAPHAWWCLCGSCGPGGNFVRADPPSREVARNWFGWAASRQTLEDARQNAFLTPRP